MSTALPEPVPRRRATPAAAPLDMAPLAGHVGFLLRLAQQRVFEEFHRGFSAAGISPARYSVLALLHANPDVQQGRLAEALRVKPSNMAVLLAEMEAQGLLDRRVDAANRRANLLRLTTAGRRLYETLTPEILAMEQQVAHRLTPTQYATLIKLLAKLSPP
jgi:DNA-binding MarR family transcriptional regulator